MRPLRLLLSLSTCLVAVTLLLYVALGSQQDEELEQNSSRGKKKGFKALFSFTSPGSLFPPSAIISLTDDNSTFFLARPAAFGPSLPKDGLSSALWIGSGFGDDAFSKGELGCGDSPEWDDRNDELSRGSHSPYSSPDGAGTHTDRSDTRTRRSDHAAAAPTSVPTTDDGSDDHLRIPLSEHHTATTYKKPILKHADIQTLQESAEIEGKVVLLKRGGCGFLAKVLWAQKRGAVAVIVGDDVRGGGLIRMYAKGDTSNITISSIFTSHTTAHLLSSLLPRGARSGVLPGASAKLEASEDGQSHTRTAEISMVSSHPDSEAMQNSQTSSQTTATDDVHGGHKGHVWLESALNALGLSHDHEHTKGTHRPADTDHTPVASRQTSSIVRPIPMATPADFVIGKQDWRDPDLVPVLTSTSQFPAASSHSFTSDTKENPMPGSGEYSSQLMTDRERKAWWSKWFASREQTNPKGGRSISSITDANLNKVETNSRKPDQHEGLWVTLTPTNVSASPFFDTLLVLVVSPLVTLTVVYALLLLRSRIRRRRWRAPKSLVERLPVRTYHTISDSSSSATSSAATPTTPLLQHSPPQPSQPVETSSAGTGEEGAATSPSGQHGSRTKEEEKREHGLAEWRRRYGGRQKECVVCLDEYVDGVSQVMSLPCGHEFHAECITPWLVTRRRTCPICKGDVVRSLAQSYHDRLPSSSPTRSTFHLGNVDDVQSEAAETRNDSPSASLPMPISSPAAGSRSRDFDDDTEANWSGDEPGQRSRDARANRTTDFSTSVRDLSSTVSTVIWRGVEAVRNTTGFQRRPPEDVDRDR
ncbi:RING-9 protein [Paraphoma chrysanthemicola]|uniref:RING-type E3 ubiquitin transferase n=1 Tax=Paraphoma chrysanthemicola TaxID=798071 RepID=A0A8K0QX65_9PLEO|nr:RING-9 protein [Paraphoma chrysanthemicola]